MAGSQAARRPGHGSGKYPSARRIEQQAQALFADCLTAFHAFNGLKELSEDMRILSLNAELVAGRAGNSGNAVRALTQYTRQLVLRLNHIQADIHGLRGSSYGVSAGTLRDLRRLRLLQRTHRSVSGRPSDNGAPTLTRLVAAQDQVLERICHAVGLLDDIVRGMEGALGRVADVVTQSDSIATNIAIEASATGQQEKEFKVVADTLRRYVAQLRDMLDMAGGAVRDASKKCSALCRMDDRFTKAA